MPKVKKNQSSDSPGAEFGVRSEPLSGFETMGNRVYRVLESLGLCVVESEAS
jgi:hypothetical protein